MVCMRKATQKTTMNWMNGCACCMWSLLMFHRPLVLSYCHHKYTFTTEQSSTFKSRITPLSTLNAHVPTLRATIQLFQLPHTHTHTFIVNHSHHSYRVEPETIMWFQHSTLNETGVFMCLHVQTYMVHVVVCVCVCVSANVWIQLTRTGICYTFQVDQPNQMKMTITVIDHT